MSSVSDPVIEQSNDGKGQSPKESVLGKRRRVEISDQLLAEVCFNTAPTYEDIEGFIKRRVKGITDMKRTILTKMMFAATEHYKTSTKNIHNIFINNYKGGKMREIRGRQMEKMVNVIVEEMNKHTEQEFKSIVGKDKMVRVKAGTFTQNIQIDRHITMNGDIVCFVECKAFIDASMFKRALFDAVLVKKTLPDAKCLVFALENCCADDTFDFLNAAVPCIDKRFTLTKGNRTATKPIYNPTFFKHIELKPLYKFCSYLLKFAKIK